MLDCSAPANASDFAGGSAKFDPHQMERLLRMLETIIVRYQLIGGGRTGRLEIVCARVAQAIFAGEIADTAGKRKAINATVSRLQRLIHLNSKVLAEFSSRRELPAGDVAATLCWAAACRLGGYAALISPQLVVAFCHGPSGRRREPGAACCLCRLKPLASSIMPRRSSGAPCGVAPLLCCRDARMCVRFRLILVKALSSA